MTDQALNILSTLVCGFKNLLMVDMLLAVVVGHHLVGDEGEAKDAQATVTCHYNLWHRAHACKRVKQMRKATSHSAFTEVAKIAPGLYIVTICHRYSMFQNKFILKLQYLVTGLSFAK